MLYLIVLLVQLVISVAMLIAMIILLRSVINGAVYYPTEPRQVELLVSMLKIKPGEKAADLGSGDGRIVIALAQAGAEAHGYETNPVLVYVARKKIKKAGLKKKAFIHSHSLWRADLSKYDAVVIYGLPHFLKRLSAKIEREMRPNTRFVSNMFEFPDWQPSQVQARAYLYEIPK